MSRLAVPAPILAAILGVAVLNGSAVVFVGHRHAPPAELVVARVVPTWEIPSPPPDIERLLLGPLSDVDNP